MVYSPTFQNTLPIPAEPAVLTAYLAEVSSAADFAIYIPWEYCQLDYSYAVLTAARTATDAVDWEIDLELDAASGTEMHSLSILTSAASVGTIVEGTVSTQAACEGLGRHNTNRDAVNIESSSGVNITGQCMLYMYFKSDYMG